ncbi:MAG TPA: metallophosphoesterase [Candidatus Saccharimonadales bacterium]|nr:metallophosphoesterase [Candidatus Saccharimonadales bacterium]
MTRIAFAADLHIDAYGSKVDPATGLNARLVDYLDTLHIVATQATDRECDALVIAGDFTERRHPAPWLVSQIRDSLEAFADPQIYLRGNHDGEIAGGSIVTVLGEEPPRTGRGRWAVTRPRKVYVDDVAVCLIPYLDRHWLRAQPGFEDVPEAQLFAVLAEQFMAIARGLYAEAQESHATAAVLVCHQTLAGALLSESQQAFLGDQQLVVNAADLAAIGFEGIVAGHLHRHQVLSTDPPVLYPGSIERVDFGEEHEAKGFIVADVGPGRFEWEFVETPARRYVTLQGDYAAEGVSEDDVEGAIVRIVDVDPSMDVAQLRQQVENMGAFEVAAIQVRPVEAPALAGGLSEALSAEQALAAYFADDPDAEALISRGRELLEAAG